MASKMDAKACLVAKLAKFLRLNGDNVINGTCKFSLTTSALCLINSVFVDLLVHDRVDSGNSTEDPASREFLEDAQFLLDFVKKTKFLKLFHGVQTLRGGIDLSYFKGVTALELKKIPAHLIVGLNTLPRLKSLTCSRSLASLKELFGSYTEEGDQSDEVWLELTDLNVSCNYLESLDCVRSVPNVEVIDASQNNLKHLFELMVLDKLIVLKLNYNMLQSVPLLNRYSAFSLKVLLMRNNNVEDLTGLELLLNLEELDISYNCVSEYNNLKPMKALKLLKSLQLKNNPVSQSKQYHERIAPYFHADVASRGIILDGKKLSPKDIQSHASGISAMDYGSRQQTSIIAIMEDKENIGACSHQPLRQLRCSPSYEKLEDIEQFSFGADDDDRSSPNSQSDNTEDYGIQSRRNGNRKLKKKVREVVILQPDKASSENAPTSAEIEGYHKEVNVPSHIMTKRLIETRRKEYGSEWLIPSHSFQTLTVNEKAHCILESSPTASISEISYSDQQENPCSESCVEPVESQISESHDSSSQGDSMKVQVGDIDTIPSDDDSSTVKVNVRKRSDVSDDIQVLEESSYEQALQSLVIDVEKFSDLAVYEKHKKEEESESDEEDIEDDVVVSDSEDENEDRIFIVERKEENKCYPLFVCIGRKFIKEKFFKTARLRDVLDLSRLLSIRINEIVLGSCQKYELTLTFDCLQANKQKRIYICDDIQYGKKMVTILQPFADAKAFEDATVGALQCLKCRSEFSRQVAHLKVQQKKKIYESGCLPSSFDSAQGAMEEADVCPNCGSNLVVELESMPLPSATLPPSANKQGPLFKKPANLSTSPTLGQLSSMLYSMIKYPKSKSAEMPITSTPKPEKVPNGSPDSAENSKFKTAASFIVPPSTDENLSEEPGFSAISEDNVEGLSANRLSRNSSDATIPSQSSIAVISSDSEGDIALDVIHERESICSPAVISPTSQLAFEGNVLLSDVIPPSVLGSPSGLDFSS